MNSLHRWWLWGCFIATLLASWAGGFGVAVTAVFIGIYLTGLVLIGPDEPEAEVVDTAEAVDAVEAVEVEDIAAEEAEPYPDDDESEAPKTEAPKTGAAKTGAAKTGAPKTDTGTDSDSDESLESSESSR